MNDKQADADLIHHNTMRFDIQLVHIQPMLDEEDVDLRDIVNAVRKAVVNAVNETVGEGLDGIPVPGGVMSYPVPDSQMLHRELICFDLS